MKPIYKSDFEEPSIFNTLHDEVDWLDTTPLRRESFMSFEPLTYVYGAEPRQLSYTSVEFHPEVLRIMERLNSETGSEYDICFLNMYTDEKKSLGWHSDDSPEIDMDHPIAVVSFGQERQIWWKDKFFKGTIPEENRQLLASGSLFIMPAGFQKDNLHRIPKNDRPCETRISLTYRKYKKP